MLGTKDQCQLTPLIALLVFLGTIGTAAVAGGGEVIHVPGDIASLQTAISQISDGGTIMIASGSILTAPVGGYRIENPGKSFTISAEVTGTVTIDGEGATNLIRQVNVSLPSGQSVTYQGLVFSNGRASALDTGAIIVIRAEATFIDCTFSNNTDTGVSANTGAVHVSLGKVFFVDCVWADNIATTAGGGLAVQSSEAWVMRGFFDSNRTNPPNHTWSSRGGGIWVGNGNLKVANSRFENNRAGYVGGGLYAIGDFLDPVSIPQSEVIVANSSFVGNGCEPDPTVVLPVPSEGGALHSENQTTTRIFSSRFIGNTSEIGGAVNLYRAIVEVENSVFIGNRAIHLGNEVGVGGAMSAASNDTNNATTGGGTINRRTSSLSVRNTYIAGLPNETAAQSGGGIRTTGDNNRVYGTGGVNPMGSVVENRAQLNINGVVFNDLELWSDPKPAFGGALTVNLTQFGVQDSLVADCRSASDDGFGQGGGMMILNQSNGVLDDVTVAGNYAQARGGGVNINGSQATISNSILHHNTIESSNVNQSFGAALYSTPDPGRGLLTGGLVENTIITSNTGLPIFDEDLDEGPVNEFVYNENSIFSSTYGDDVYKDRLASSQTVSGLNQLVISRSVGAPTTKSTIDNIEEDSDITTGYLRAVPAYIVPMTAVGDDETATQSFLAYAWSGDAATLDGQSLTDPVGVQQHPAVGGHALVVDGVEYLTTVTTVGAPSATFSSSPIAITSGTPSILSWTTPANVFLEMDIDQGVEVLGDQATGSVEVFPTSTTTYRLYVVTKFGGVVEEVTVYVDEAPPNLPLFADGFESGDIFSWSNSAP